MVMLKKDDSAKVILKHSVLSFVNSLAFWLLIQETGTPTPETERDVESKGTVELIFPAPAHSHRWVSYNRLAEITREILLNVTYTSKPSCGGSKVIKDKPPEGKE